MNVVIQDYSQWYTKMLMPLDKKTKLSIISKLSESILEEENKNDQTLDLFDGLNNSWCDDVSDEIEV